MLKTSVIYADTFDPWQNLALEELLLQQVEDDEVILYLWQNQHTVVVGRNQNAWKECHVSKLEADGGKLARRLSGGGAVYHDLGNLNFTFIMPKPVYDLERQLSVILEAVRALGVSAEFSGRNDILAEGRKFSGNAFYHGQRASYHHGTLLVSVDMAVLPTYLNVPQQKMASKGVQSVRSRVINLCELIPNLTIEHTKEAMRQAFVKEYGGTGHIRSSGSLASTTDFKELTAKYASWEWRLGKSPAFDTTYETRFPWGGVEIGLMVRNGHVVDAKVYSDAMEAHLWEPMAQSLVGVAYNQDTMASALQALSETLSEPLVLEVAEWLKQV